MDYGRPITLKRELSYVDSSSLEGYGDDQNRKRTRTFTRSCTSSFPLQPPVDTSNLSCDRHERRRVNPEALALRLGPELVKELDALITPGMIEMPPFSARRQIQERFKVDRRHIYDYYHAKGLRVLKDADKATPMKDTAGLAFDTGGVHNLRSVRGPPSRRVAAQRNATFDISPSRTARKNTRPRLSMPQLEHHSFPLASATPPSTGSHFSVLSYPSHVHSPADPDVYRELVHASGNDARMPEPSYFDAVTDDANPQSTINFDYSQDFYSSTQDSMSTIFGGNDWDSETASSQTLTTPPPLDLGDLLEPEFASGSPVPAMLPLDGQDTMTQKEREECYLLFAHALDSSSGVQESVGSYKSFMTAQKEDYFGHVKSPVAAPPNTPTPVQPDYAPAPPATCDLFGDKTPPTPEEQAEDFKKWLMPTRRRELKALGLPPPSMEKENASDDNMNILLKMWAPPKFGAETGLPPPPSVEDIFAPNRPPPQPLPPPVATRPEDFQAYPDADFHIHGVPIICHKPNSQQMSSAQMMQAPSQNVFYADQLFPPPYAMNSQSWSTMDSAAMLDMQPQLALPPYMLPHGMPNIMQPCESSGLTGTVGELSAGQPGQEASMFTPEAQPFQPPLYAPAPSRPRLGWLGVDQGRSMSGRLRGFSASGDL